MAIEQKQYKDLEDLVFENRNKSYGAYYLRKVYEGFLTKAFFLGTSLFLLLIILPFIYLKSTEGEKVKNVMVDLEVKDLNELEMLEEEKQVIEEEEIFEVPKEEVQSLDDLAPPSENLEPVATIQNIVPEPTKNPEKETPPPTQEELKDKAIGTENIEGANVSHNAVQPVNGVEGGRGTQAVKEGVEIVDTKSVHDNVDVEADFPNGINSFRMKVQENFDTESVEGEGILTTEVVFVVELDGSITQVKAKGPNSDFNREAERVIKSIRTKWKPAKKGNINVRSRFRFPLKMRFE